MMIFKTTYKIYKVEVLKDQVIQVKKNLLKN